MDFINLLINNPVACVAVASLGFNAFLARRIQIRSEEAGTNKALIDAKDKEIERLISEGEQSKKTQEETVINITQDNEQLRKQLNHTKPPVIIPKPLKTMGSGEK